MFEIATPELRNEEKEEAEEEEEVCYFNRYCRNVSSGIKSEM